ncbi:MAG: MFS transporter [Cellvibrionaceae bacterium]|nr:MFS transporter [Cellvibrionaceae bacterium]|tara:strand:+ start:52291 stop:52608 length:318 start_codon:yes stop_codon:yes gene_type:complete
MQKLCSLSELEDRQSRGFTIGEDAIFTVRQGQQLYIYRNRCPHLGIQLEWLEDKFLDYDGELIQCSTHGALFTIDEGFCVSGPCGGQSLTPVEHERRGDEIWVQL